MTRQDRETEAKHRKGGVEETRTNDEELHAGREEGLPSWFEDGLVAEAKMFKNRRFGVVDAKTKQ